MAADTDVLIVGAGPTGLMFACELLRSGIKFRLIDKNSDRAQESRALVIHAKTMELFQNLGLSQEFLNLARSSIGVQLFVNGEEKADLSFRDIGVAGTPFPSIYFLAQSETERILIEHLERRGVVIERQTELRDFHQTADGVQARLFHEKADAEELVYSQYLIGCDGAHSKVRHGLNMTFNGAPYEQDFILADVIVKWPFATNKLSIFLNRSGVLAHFPLDNQTSRLIISQTQKKKDAQTESLSLQEVEALATKYTKAPVSLSEPKWITRFHLHHRSVPHYSEGRVFLAGDAAHIHSPAGGQGMNTGIQDAANLAWKMALVLKGVAPVRLLETYNEERFRIGQVLLKTTDRFFSLATSDRFFPSYIRILFVPWMAKFMLSEKSRRRRAFRTVSQLGIHYHENSFISELTGSEESKFSRGPRAGARAPDAPTDQGNLFEIMKDARAHVFSLEIENGHLHALRHLKEKYKGWVQFHRFRKNSLNLVLFDRYGIEKSGLYFIRPDGYIGYRCEGQDFEALAAYLQHLYENVPARPTSLPAVPHGELSFHP
jgi:2-polyprenyl-6-methoxyphenol hydroxylase-like FAD-dependent oxidoreductase